MPALGVNATWGQEQWSTYLIQHLAEQSALLRAGCRFLPVGGRNVHIPRTLLDGTAGWVAELAPIPSDSPTGDELVLTPKKTGNVVSLSRESVEDSPISELDAVGNALTRSVARAVDVAALGSAAATATTPGGLLTASVPTQTGGVGSVDTFLSAIGKIEAVGGVADTIFMNPADKTALTLVKDATGSSRPLLIPDPQQRQSYQIGGATIYSTSAIATGFALVVEAAQIVVAVRRDISVDFSGEALFTSDGIVARVTARFDWGWGDIRGACIVKT
jgi:HK97 family phage major capsid protein